MPKTPDEIFSDKIKFLFNIENDTDGKVVKFQRELFSLLVDEYLPLFELENGIVINSTKNISLINNIDSVFNKLEKALHRDVFGTFIFGLTESASLSSEYYEALGFKKTVINSILKNKVDLEGRLGITSTGKLKNDGYLFRLGKTEQVRHQLKNYVINSLTGNVSFLDFQLGFRNLVIGNKRQKALPTTGNLQRYFDQFAYDTFNEMDAIANQQLASNLQLKHFIYEGSLIKSSRRFCIKRAGKVFTVKETRKWKNDPDLIDKKTKNSYRPLIERGRYRCRHFIKYITEGTFKELKNAK